jgi:hypothetical protein
MSKVRSLTIVAVAVAAIATLGVLLSADKLIGTKPPISFRYVKTGKFNNGGYISFGTTFWATNHTSKTLAVGLSAIEVKAGSDWISPPRDVQLLLFRPPGKPLEQLELNPHEAGYATTELSGQPTGGTWRVKVSVQEKLRGFAQTRARIRLYVDLLERRLRTGNTNAPWNPLNPFYFYRRSFYGPVTEVVSQEIADD